MTLELTAAAKECRLDATDHEDLRYAFGLACAGRVRHLLREPRLADCLDVLKNYVEGERDVAQLKDANAESSEMAEKYAAVGAEDANASSVACATLAVAKALSGDALEAAAYAARALGSDTASETGWQVGELRRLAAGKSGASTAS